MDRCNCYRNIILSYIILCFIFPVLSSGINMDLFESEAQGTESSSNPITTITPAVLVIDKNADQFGLMLLKRENYEANVDIIWRIVNNWGTYKPGILVEIYTINVTEHYCTVYVNFSGTILQFTGFRQSLTFETNNSDDIVVQVLCFYSGSIPLTVEFSGSYTVTVSSVETLQPPTFKNIAVPNVIDRSLLDVIYNISWTNNSCYLCVIQLIFDTFRIGPTDYVILYDNDQANTDVPPVRIYNGDSHVENYVQPYDKNSPAHRNLIIRYTTSNCYDLFDISAFYTLIPSCFTSNDEIITGIAVCYYTSYFSPYYPNLATDIVMRYLFTTDENYVLSWRMGSWDFNKNTSLEVYNGLDVCTNLNNWIMRITSTSVSSYQVETNTNLMSILFNADDLGGRFEGYYMSIPLRNASSQCTTTGTTATTTVSTLTTSIISSTWTPFTTSSTSLETTTSRQYSTTPTYYLQADQFGFITSPYNNRPIYPPSDPFAITWEIVSNDDNLHGILLDVFLINVTTNYCTLSIDYCTSHFLFTEPQEMLQFDSGYWQCSISVTLSCSNNSQPTPLTAYFSASYSVSVTKNDQLSAVDSTTGTISYLPDSWSAPEDVIYNISSASNSCALCTIHVVFQYIALSPNDHILLYDNQHGSIDVYPNEIYNATTDVKKYIQPYNYGQPKRNLVVRITYAGYFSSDVLFTYLSAPYCLNSNDQKISVAIGYLSNFGTTSIANTVIQYFITAQTLNYAVLVTVDQWYFQGDTVLYFYDGFDACETPDTWLMKITASTAGSPINVESKTNSMSVLFSADTYGGSFSASCTSIPVVHTNPNSNNTAWIIGFSVAAFIIIMLSCVCAVVERRMKMRSAVATTQRSNTNRQINVTNESALNVDSAQSLIYQNVPDLSAPPSYQDLFPNAVPNRTRSLQRNDTTNHM